MQNTNCIVILGPTASGKTQLACSLAAELNAEIISFDSRQVYKRLNIGTGKDLNEYVVNGKQIPYHLIDVCEPSQQFFLHDFIREFDISFNTILHNEKIPILCGGTGLYLDVLRKDFSFTQIPEDPELRSALQNRSKEELLKILDVLPKGYHAHVDRHSVKRILRGIEVAQYLGENNLQPGNPKEKYRPIYVGINIETKTLRHRIRERLLKRMEHGLIEEGENLLKSKLSHDRMQQLGLEYKFLSFYLQNKISRAELTEQLYTAICQFARRQMTWFRKMEREGVTIHWVNSETNTQHIINTFMLSKQ